MVVETTKGSLLLPDTTSRLWSFASGVNRTEILSFLKFKDPWCQPPKMGFSYLPRLEEHTPATPDGGRSSEPSATRPTTSPSTFPGLKSTKGCDSVRYEWRPERTFEASFGTGSSFPDPTGATTDTPNGVSFAPSATPLCDDDSSSCDLVFETPEGDPLESARTLHLSACVDDTCRCACHVLRPLPPIPYTDLSQPEWTWFSNLGE